MSTRQGRYGKEFAVTGSGTGRLVFDTPQEQSEITIALTGTIDAGINICRFWSNYNGVGAGKFDIYYDASFPNWMFQIIKTGSPYQVRLTGLSPAFAGTLVLVSSGGVLSSAWLNGEAVGLTAYAPGSGSVVAGSYVTALCGRADVTTRQMDGGLAMFARYDRALSAANARALSQPGAMQRLAFAPQCIVIPGYVAAGGLPTLSAPTYKPGTLSASGFTPRVTAS